jgi:hypothetical protein
MYDPTYREEYKEFEVLTCQMLKPNSALDLINITN